MEGDGPAESSRTGPARGTADPKPEVPGAVPAEGPGVCLQGRDVRIDGDITQHDSGPVETEYLPNGGTRLRKRDPSGQRHRDIDGRTVLSDRHSAKWRGSARTGTVVTGYLKYDCLRRGRRNHEAYRDYREN